MNRTLSIIAGLMLVALGVVALGVTVGLPLLGWNAWEFGLWRLWPLLVLTVGVCFVLPPVLAPRKRGLGALFIPGFPILTTGCILLANSVFNAWELWARFWPLEVLSLALGFLFAAILMRESWLLFPAIIIGLNGVVFQFCALTGWWGSWSILWTVEPLAVGLAFLVLALKHRKPELVIAGAILCGMAALGFMGMSALFASRWWGFGLLGPLFLVALGCYLLVWGLTRRAPAATPAAPAVEPPAPTPEGAAQ